MGKLVSPMIIDINDITITCNPLITYLLSQLLNHGHFHFFQPQVPKGQRLRLAL